MVKRGERASRWPFFAPASFRHWVQRGMTPLAFDHAQKKKYRLSVFYLIVSAFTLNYIIYTRHYKTPKATVEDELSDELSTMISIAHVENPRGYVYTFNNFNLSEVEHFDKKEWEKKRQEGS